MRWRGVVAACVGLASSALGADGQLSGKVSVENWHYFDDPLFPGQRSGEDLSIAFEPQFHVEWAGGTQQFTFTPFGRIDRLDPDRTHADIREMEWILVRQAWELRIGIRKVFWGVTESQHLVDIINQTDLVENPDGEQKLGQPMVNLALTRDWGNIDIFLMPWFRERTFPGREGRLRFALPVDSDHARFVSGGGRSNLDWALRWSRAIGNLDIGVSYFKGTGRDPLFEPAITAGGEAAVIPLYFEIDQIGLDAQLVWGDTLWKLEAVRRAGLGGHFVGATAGIEHTLYGILGTAADLGLLAEYLYNDKNNAQILAFENDLFVGLRLTMNDAKSTEVLVGVIKDIDDPGMFYNLEASRRFGEAWRLNLEGRVFSGLTPGHPQYSIRNDDYIRVELAYYF